MNQNVNIADIISKLNEIDELIKSFNEGNFSTIDKDLMLEKVRLIYETVLTNKSGTKTTEINTKSKSQPQIEKPVKKEKIAEPVKPVENINDSVIHFSEEPNEKTESQVNEKKPIDDYPTLFEVETKTPSFTLKEEEPIQIKTEKTEIFKQNTSSKTISDKYSESKNQTVSDRVSKSNTNDKPSKQTLKPIANIKSAISINDRIMFTKELFENDAAYYNEIIEKINSMKNLEEALEHLKMEIDITQESEAVQKFTELVHRRFL
jgi:hypothetical protein